MKHILTIVLLFSVSLLWAQPKMEFDKTVHDYGSIKEDGGIAEAVFTFTNAGNQPLVLNNVRASCGCTTPQWTKEPVLPGKTGEIKVGYNPKNRPGPFSKTVNVYANTQPSVVVLNIKGKVEPREKTLEEKYPRVMGPLRWKTNYLSMGSMYVDEVKSGVLDFVNTSDQPASFGVYRAPEHISVEFEPSVVQPGSEGKMKITYDANKKNAYGYVSDRVYLLINDQKENTYSVGVSVTLNENFSKLSANDLAKAPVAVFDNKVFDFGTITQGETVSHEFKLTNKGESDLLIRNVRASCGCTAVKNESLVKPGQTIALTVDFNSRGKRSRQNKSVTITTNDPKNPTTILRVMGTVQVPAAN
ncbi:DUF1573 domain-containing protein [Roseimarinus sediminis]|uniref:DUF1573 domain-containing protein n=1 Tax=Roseimarinus sediminis TaxID=1610899 RepID=UPI003D2544AA